MAVHLAQGVARPSHAPSIATLAALQSALSSFRITSPSTSISGRRNASHQAQGRANGAKDGPGKRLGAKKTGGQYVVPGNILFKQRGTHWFPGDGCFMGRDHTIHAKVPGYVKYYLDPARHPKRKYIGVVFEKDQTLPQPANAIRRRRLGMLAYQMPSAESNSMEEVDVGSASLAETTTATAAPPSIPQPLGGAPQRVTVRRERPGMGKKPETIETTVTLRPGYQWREANWEIGRSAENKKAEQNVQHFTPGDRFLAWRKRNLRKARSAERRSLGRGGKAAKPKKGGKRR